MVIHTDREKYLQRRKPIKTSYKLKNLHLNLDKQDLGAYVLASQKTEQHFPC